MKWKSKFQPKIVDFVKKNPNCARKDVYDALYKKKYGERKIFSKNIGLLITKMVENNELNENNIIRTKHTIKSSNLIFPKDKITIDDGAYKMQVKKKKYRPKTAKPLQKTAKPLQKSMYKYAIENEKLVIKILDSPKGISEIGKEISTKHQTIYNILTRLRSRGVVIQNPETKKWSLTKIGGKIRREEISDSGYKNGFERDNFYLHLPFLVKPNEKLSIGKIAERAYGFLGHYYKQGISDSQAEEDFLRRIEKHLSDSSVSSFIKPLRFKFYQVVCSEETLYLWRLESLIKTVLYKSTEKKIGLGVELYDKLTNLLRKEFSNIEEKIRDLPEKEQYVIWLMLNGVQLETILPPYEIVPQSGEGIKNIIMSKGFSIKTYNYNSENETTLIEED